MITKTVIICSGCGVVVQKDKAVVLYGSITTLPGEVNGAKDILIPVSDQSAGEAWCKSCLCKKIGGLEIKVTRTGTSMEKILGGGGKLEVG